MADPAAFRDRIVILVDDGLATEATMRAAVRALRQSGAAKIVVVCTGWPARDLPRNSGGVDEMSALRHPNFFKRSGKYYQDFSQTSDEEERASCSRLR